jgi:hypothetical protein
MVPGDRIINGITRNMGKFIEPSGTSSTCIDSRVAEVA